MLNFGVIPWSYSSNPDRFQQSLNYTDKEWDSILSGINVRSHLVLTTCNRSELYFTYQDDSETEAAIFRNFPEALLSGDAIEHLFRVSSGLESMSVGENEILAQLKDAYTKAREKAHTDKMLSLIMRKTISVGKEVREKTNISRGKTSIPVIAVDLARSHAVIEGSAIAVVGTGRMAETFLRYIIKMKPSYITIIGRNSERGEYLAEQYGCKYSGMNALQQTLNDVRIAFVATSSRNHIITQATLPDFAGHLLIVDISNPENVDPGITRIDGIEFIGMKEIQGASTNGLQLKREEIPKVEKLLKMELENFDARLREFHAEEFLAESYQFIESIVLNETGRFVKEIDNGKEPVAAGHHMAQSITNKLLFQYTVAMKEAAGKGDMDLISKLRKIFAED